MDLDKIRKEFPLLNNGEKLVYFDNACATLRPEVVIKAIDDYYRFYPSCGGRSVHRFGRLVTEKFEEARKEVASFIGANVKEIIFTKNATEGLNLLAYSLSLPKDSVVLTSDKEHNSNLVPWQLLGKKKGFIHRVLPSLTDNTFDLDKFKEFMSGGGVSLVSLVATSNLDGVTFPMKEITEIAHQYGALVVFDATQTVLHQRINVKEIGVDFLVFSGHKILGPSGVGILYGRSELLKNLEPFLVGGNTVEYSTYEDHRFLLPPEKFEAGLQNYSGVIGLGEAIKFLKTLDFTEIKKQELILNKYISEELLSLPKIKLIGPRDPALRGGIFSFYVDNLDSHQIALILDQNNIMVRSGQHCVHSYFHARGIKSAVRVSLAFYNNMEEAKIFVENMKKIIRLA